MTYFDANGENFDLGIQKTLYIMSLEFQAVFTEGDSKVAHWVTFYFVFYYFLGGIWMALI